jgi:hypothetical protein
MFSSALRLCCAQVELVNLTVDYKQKMYADGSYYDGELNEKGERHGFGLMRWKNGDWIQGDFENDTFMRGRGKRIVGSEVKEGMWDYGGTFVRRFEGTWSPDEPYSKGIVYYTDLARNGEVYEGEFMYHKRHGQGKRVLLSGSKWEGEWKDDKFQRGRYTDYDGTYFEGEFEHIFLHGKGKHVTNEYSDEGLFKSDRIVKGKRTWRNGDVYEGSFSSNDAHGFGVMLRKSDSSRYEGLLLRASCRVHALLALFDL